MLQEEELPEPDTTESMEALASRVGKSVIAEAVASDRPVSPILPKPALAEGSVTSLDGDVSGSMPPAGARLL